jgi:hypothetical protein
LDEPPLSPEQRAELQMFDRFLEARQAPDWLRRRCRRRYIEEEFLKKEFLKSKMAGVDAWFCRLYSAGLFVVAMGFWWLSPEEFPGYMIPVIFVISALYFWLGEKKKGAALEMWLFRLTSASVLIVGIGFWRSSPTQYSDYTVPGIVILSALMFWVGERRKR